MRLLKNRDCFKIYLFSLDREFKNRKSSGTRF
jgi:hypothetical protein